MLNDLVYLLQNKLVTADTLYEHAVKLFDSGDRDVPWLFSEISRISAIAKFSRSHDSGITNAFTDQTFERISEYKATLTVPFSMTSLLESGYDEAQIQLPGFVSVHESYSSTEEPVNENDNNTGKDLTNVEEKCGLTTELDVVSNNSENDINTGKDLSNVKEKCGLTTEPDVVSNNSENDDNYQTFETDVLDVPITKFDSAYTYSNSEEMHNGMNITIIGELETPDYINNSDKNNKLTFDDVDSIHNDLDSKTSNQSTIAAYSTSENGTKYRCDVTESELNIMTYYKHNHFKLNDPYQPDDYYAQPDICSKMTEKYSDRSPCDINQTVIHLPLRVLSKLYLNNINFIATSPLFDIRKVSYVPIKPAIFTSFIKIYEVPNFKHGLFDCQTIKLYSQNNHDVLLSFKFAEQHNNALYANIKPFIANKTGLKLRFNSYDITYANESNKTTINSTILKLYKYGQLFILTTYHSYMFRLITAIIFTGYDKILASNSNLVR